MLFQLYFSCTAVESLALRCRSLAIDADISAKFNNTEYVMKARSMRELVRIFLRSLGILLALAALSCLLRSSPPPGSAATECKANVNRGGAALSRGYRILVNRLLQKPSIMPVPYKYSLPEAEKGTGKHSYRSLR